MGCKTIHRWAVNYECSRSRSRYGPYCFIYLIQESFYLDITNIYLWTRKIAVSMQDTAGRHWKSYAEYTYLFTYPWTLPIQGANHVHPCLLASLTFSSCPPPLLTHPTPVTTTTPQANTQSSPKPSQSTRPNHHRNTVPTGPQNIVRSGN